MTVTLTTNSSTITLKTTTATTSYSGSEIRTLGGMLGRGRLAITGAYTVVDADRGKTVDATSGTFSLGLTSAATLGSGWHFTAANSGSGTVTIDPASTETIRGPAGSASTLALTQGQAVTLVSDGTNWLVVSSVGLAPVSSATIITSTIQAATSAGITVQNSTPATVMTIGPGPGTGVAFAGGITSAAITATSASGITTLQAATQDAIALLGRAGGTSSYVGTITPTTLTASRTYTMPDASIVVSGSAAALTSGRVPYVTTGGLLLDSASLTYSSGAQTLSVGDATSGPILDLSIGAASSGRLRFTVSGGGERGYLSYNGSSNIFRLDSDGSLELAANNTAFFTMATTGALTYTGNISQTGATTFSTGTGAVTINGSTTIVAGKTLTLSDTTASTSSSTGALVVSGGAGIGGDMTFAYNGSNGGYRVVQFTDNVSSVNFVIGRSSNTYTTGGAVGWLGNNQAFVYSATTFRLGVTTGTNTYFEIANTSCSFGSSYQVNVLSTTASTSTSTGALVVSGGVGVAGQITFNGNTGLSLRVTNGVANAAVATTLGSVGPTGSTAGDPQGWLRISVAGTDRYIPYW